MKINYFLCFFIVGLLLGLVGCGGGELINTVYVLALSASPSTITANGTATSTITATLKDREGKAIEKHHIKFSLISGGGTLANQNIEGVLTDRSGQAAIAYTSGTTTGSVAIQGKDYSASLENVISTVTLTLEAN
jgi:hypothetical protein